MSELIKKKGGIQQIKTPQSLVHIKHTITHRQYKYWYILLRLYRALLDSEEKQDKDGFYYVPMATLSDFLGYEPVKAELKKDFEALRREPIVINYLEKDGGKALHGMGFVSEWKISSTKIGFKLPSFIVNAIEGNEAEKQMFLLLNWNIFNSFTGKYEAIIYKLCKDYIGIGRTPYMSINEYRDYIGLKDDEYTATDNLTRRCILNPTKAINENELSDISVSVEFTRNGRKVEGLYFKAEHKKQMKIPFDDFKPHPAFDRSKVAIAPEEQAKHLERYTPEQIEAIIERANEYSAELKGKGKTDKIGGIYKRAFAEGWGLDTIEAKKAEKAEKQARLEQRQAEQAKHQEAESKAEQELKSRLEAYERLSEDEKNGILQAVLAQVPKVLRASIERAYKEHGVNAPAKSSQVRGMLLAYLNK